MDQLNINGSGVGLFPMPAGAAIRSLAGLSGAQTLAGNEAAADIITLTGALGAAVTLTVPTTPSAPQVNSTNPSSVLYNNQATVLSWIKIFQNFSTGFAVTLSNGGTTVVLTAGSNKAQFVYSPDGVNLYAATVAT